MAHKIRKQIYINPQQETLLKQISTDTGVSEAEIIRQAVDYYAIQKRSPRRDITAWERLQLRMQQLIDKGTVPGERTWRREDLYER